MRIRQALVTDAPALAAAERLIVATPGLLVSRPDEITDAGMARRIQEAARFLVAESDDGGPAGHAMLDPMGLAAVEHVLRLTIVVYHGARRHGIGERLLRELLDWSRATGVVKIELLVRATNLAAIALYRKLGFAEEGRLARRVRLPDGSLVDDLTMAWLP